MDKREELGEKVNRYCESKCINYNYCDSQKSCVSCMTEYTLHLLQLQTIAPDSLDTLDCDEDCEKHGGCAQHVVTSVLKYVERREQT